MADIPKYYHSIGTVQLLDHPLRRQQNKLEYTERTWKQGSKIVIIIVTGKNLNGTRGRNPICEHRTCSTEREHATYLKVRKLGRWL